MNKETQDKINDLIQMANHKDADVTLLLEAAYVRGEKAGIERAKELAIQAIREER